MKTKTSKLDSKSKFKQSTLTPPSVASSTDVTEAKEDSNSQISQGINSQVRICRNVKEKKKMKKSKVKLLRILVPSLSASRETTNEASLINTEELGHKVTYEELYKRRKKKLLEKLCIHIMILIEECKTKECIEYSEAYLDSSMNECKTEEYVDNKPKIAENISEINGNLKNIINREIYHYTGEDNFKKKIDEWIREDYAYVKYIHNNGIIDKSIEIVETYFLEIHKHTFKKIYSDHI
ncbi:STP1 protein [Plasmodium malariae]|uniref:STP1 protein n=1 Tax=Plasmodium malariae TaxID=5858 RepID=A0A1A8WWT6_PLAMA|nr:STP1 protein [Plasmodium malariae]